MIHLAEVTQRYMDGDGTPVAAVSDVSLHVPAGKITLLTGPSGSGKTTLLTLVGAMARPTAGRIHLVREGVRTELTSLPERFRTELRRRTFGFIFQHYQLVPGLSALENVILPARPLGLKARPLQEKGLALLERFGVAPRAATPVERLSGGEQQRVAIARALINDPAVLIADEPTAHLDSARTRDFLDLLAAFRAEGRTVVLTSHDPQVLAAGLADLRVTLRDGRLVDPAAP
jgi:putative ABC transport system ATP-binding protein